MKFSPADISGFNLNACSLTYFLDLIYLDVYCRYLSDFKWELFSLCRFECFFPPSLYN